MKGIKKEEKPRSVLLTGPNDVREIILYKDKAPYDDSGESIKGGIEYDSEDDTIRCHECGAWFKSTGGHIRRHGLSAREYKLKHNLKMATALVSESVRVERISIAKKYLPAYRLANKEKFDKYLRKLIKGRRGLKKIRTRSVEEANFSKSCPPQALLKLKMLAEQIGRTPTVKEMREYGISVRGLKWTFGNLENVMKVVGLIHRRKGSKAQLIHDKNSLIALLKNFVSVHGRLPSYSDLKRGMLPSSGVFNRVFGSWGNAKKAAGFKLYPNSSAAVWTNKQLLDGLKRVILTIGKTPLAREHKRYGIPSRSTYDKRFGNLKKALKLIGIDVYHRRNFSLEYIPKEKVNESTIQVSESHR